jgi:hypothetical protein
MPQNIMFVWIRPTMGAMVESRGNGSRIVANITPNVALL